MRAPPPRSRGSSGPIGRGPPSRDPPRSSRPQPTRWRALDNSRRSRSRDNGRRYNYEEEEEEVVEPVPGRRYNNAGQEDDQPLPDEPDAEDGFEDPVPAAEELGYDGFRDDAEQEEVVDPDSLEGGEDIVSEVEEEEDDDLPRREDDLALEEVPEEMRESVEGNMELKRILSTDSMTVSGTSKRRRQNSDDSLQTPKQPLEGAKAEVTVKWRLENDVASRYVLESAEMEDVERLLELNWMPARHEGQKSAAEQISERLIRQRETKCPPGTGVDVVLAFKHRSKLGAEEEKTLRELCHKDLRHVITHYDGTRPIDDLLNEAGMVMPEEDKTTDAAPQKPGLKALSRFNRLELIDPIADALVVGDANLTFSTLLAQHREGLGHVGRIVATTFETIETLRERYPEIDSTVKDLEDKSAEVLHNVDCTRLAVDPRFLGMTGKFGAVYYNFPHAGVVKGFFDGHPFVRWRHENLMHLFFRALRCFVKPDGTVKVSSNSNATGVRFSDIMMAASSNEFLHVETVPFLEWQLRTYRRSYGDRRDERRRPDDGDIYRSQRAHSDMVYCFRYAPTGSTPPKSTIRYPPSKTDLLTSNEGRFKGLSEAARRRQIEDLWNLFLTYVQGIHVG